MIFVTVGTDLPFNRMVKIVDEWARDAHRDDVFAQIGGTEWTPKHIRFAQFMDPPEFTRRMAEATAIVSHAGMGTILSALNAGKPILIMPRRASLGEQRNEHQLATARHLLKMGKVNVAFEDSDLRRCLDCLHDLKPREKIAASASPELLATLRRFIHHETPDSSDRQQAHPARHGASS